MSTLATLNVVLNGDIGGFLKSMKQAESQSQQSSGIISRALGGIGEAAKLAGTLAVAGIGAIATAAISGVAAYQSWGKQLDSIGDVLGTNANDSAALAVAIRRVGGDVDGITTQMGKLAKGLQDTNGKLTPTAKLMQGMGIQFQDAKGKMLPATSILENVANRLAKMPDGLEKTAIMMQLFGKSGKDLSDTMNALANGGLEAARKKAEALGLAIGEDGVARSIEFDKSMEDLKMSLQGIAVSIGATVMPVLLPLIQRFAEWAVKTMPKVREGIQTAFNWIKTNVGPIIDELLKGLGAVVKWVQDNWPGISTEISNTFDKVKEFLTPIIETIITVLGKVWTIITGVFNAIKTFIEQHGDDIRNFLAGAWETISGIIATVVKIINDTIVPVLTSIATFIQTHGDTIQGILSTAWNAIKDVVNTVLGAIQGLLVIFDNIFSGNWEDVWNGIKTFVEGIWDGLKTTFSNLLTGLGQILDSIFPGFTENWKKFWDGAAKIANDIIDGIKQTWADFLNVISGGASGMQAAAEKALADAKAASAASANNPLQSHALGGPVMAGAPYWVGESGPEPFISARNGYMLSHADAMRALSGAGGGGTASETNYNVTINDPLSAAIWLTEINGRQRQAANGLM